LHSNAKHTIFPYTTLFRSPVKKQNPPKTKQKKNKAKYPGERVQIDIKYVPNECIGFASNTSRYYQITAIDEYSRKRYMEIVNERSDEHTSELQSRENLVCR